MHVNVLPLTLYFLILEKTRTPSRYFASCFITKILTKFSVLKNFVESLVVKEFDKQVLTQYACSCSKLEKQIFSRFAMNIFRKETYELMQTTLANHNKFFESMFTEKFWTCIIIKIHFVCRLDHEEAVLLKGTGFLLYHYRRN